MYNSGSLWRGWRRSGKSRRIRVVTDALCDIARLTLAAAGAALEGRHRRQHLGGEDQDSVALRRWWSDNC